VFPVIIDVDVETLVEPVVADRAGPTGGAP